MTGDKNVLSLGVTDRQTDRHLYLGEKKFEEDIHKKRNLELDIFLTSLRGFCNDL